MAASSSFAYPGLLALNNDHAVETSLLDEAAFLALVEQAFWFGRLEDDAFILTFDQNARYSGQNFLWFKQRFDRFVYVDRIVVASLARGRGLARRFYEELFQRALSAGHSRITCEVNQVPPNLASDAFHARLGFAEVGTAILDASGKTVRYLAREIGPFDP